MLIGAPQGKFATRLTFSEIIQGGTQDTGVVYSCTLSQTCSKIGLNFTSEHRKIEFAWNSKNAIVYKKNGWFGAAMDVERKNGKLTVNM